MTLRSALKRVNSNDWAAMGVAIVTLLVAFMTGIRHLVKYYLSELKDDGNGGHNLVGRVERIESRVDEIYSLLISRVK